MKTQLTLILLVITNATFSQKITELNAAEFNQELTPFLQALNEENSVLRFKKETYDDIRTNNVLESVNGVVYHGAGDVYRLQLPGITVLQTKEMTILADSTLKLVQVSDVDESIRSFTAFQGYSEETLMNYKLEKLVFPGYIILRGTPLNTQNEQLEFYIDQKSKRLYKLKIQLPAHNYFSKSEDDNTLEQPYILLVYEPIQALKKNEVSFAASDFFTSDKEHNMILTEVFSSYQLHDARTKSLK